MKDTISKDWLYPFGIDYEIAESVINKKLMIRIIQKLD